MTLLPDRLLSESGLEIARVVEDDEGALSALLVPELDGLFDDLDAVERPHRH